jgi:nitroreductase
VKERILANEGDSISASSESAPALADVADGIDQAITSRHSCRRFLPDKVTRQQIEHLLDVARWAPSGTNTQPWHVIVVAGAARDAMCDEIVCAASANPSPASSQGREYEYYPSDWFEPYLGRRRACGWGLYGCLGITRENKAGMTEQRLRNYRFFGAPVGLIVTIDRRLNRGSWMDLGMFIQNLSLSARGMGLHTCAQAAFADYHDIIRRHLAIDSEQIVVCGMAIGYRDPNAPENVWRTDRESVDRFTSWHGL